MAAAAKPDGYTIAQLPLGVYRLPLMQPVSYDPKKDFTHVISLSGYVTGVAVTADSPFKTWLDVVEYAKANPGAVTYASSGVASLTHLGMETIARHAGIELNHVPFKSTAEMNNALLGGRVMLSASGSSSMPLVKAGKLRFLQLWTKQRLAEFPDVLTLRELGYPFDLEEPLGLAGPKGMDLKIVKKLHDAFKASLEDPKVKETLEQLDVLPAYIDGPEFKAQLEAMADADRGNDEGYRSC